jgi:hypothetical protein
MKDQGRFVKHPVRQRVLRETCFRWALVENGLTGGEREIRTLGPLLTAGLEGRGACNAKLKVAAKGLLGHHTALLPPSYLDFGAQFDDPVRRDAEEIGRPRRNAREAGIKALAPSCDPGP